MKTAEETLKEMMPDKCGCGLYETVSEWHIESMKSYAKQVAEQAIKDAFNKLVDSGCVITITQYKTYRSVQIQTP